MKIRNQTLDTCNNIAGLHKNLGLTFGSAIMLQRQQRAQRCCAECDPAAQLAIAERQSILISLDNLMSYPWIRDRVAAHTLSLHGWYFDIRDGALHGYDLDTRQFMPLVCPIEKR